MTPYPHKGNSFHFLFYVLRIKSHQLYYRMWHVSDHVYISLIWVVSYKKENIPNDCYFLTCCQCVNAPDYTNIGPVAETQQGIRAASQQPDEDMLYNTLLPQDPSLLLILHRCSKHQESLEKKNHGMPSFFIMSITCISLSSAVLIMMHVPTSYGLSS